MRKTMGNQNDNSFMSQATLYVNETNDGQSYNLEKYKEIWILEYIVFLCNEEYYASFILCF